MLGFFVLGPSSLQPWQDQLIALELSKPELDQSTTKHSELILAVSILWEGDQIEAHNIEAIKDFRQRFPSIPLIQFFNPAYLTRSSHDPETVAEIMKSTTRPNDITALHLHGWKSLIESAGVAFRSAPTIWGHRLDPRLCRDDCGGEVPISAYTQKEITRIIDHSCGLLETYNLGRPEGFLAGAWMASHAVFEALAENQIWYDFSLVPASTLAPDLEAFPVYSWIRKLWDQSSPLVQPKKIYTSQGWIHEMGNNAATMDYQSTTDLLELFRAHVQRANASGKTQFVHISFYQETAAKQLPHLSQALSQFATLSKNLSVKVYPAGKSWIKRLRHSSSFARSDDK